MRGSWRSWLMGSGLGLFFLWGCEGFPGKGRSDVSLAMLESRIVTLEAERREDQRRAEELEAKLARMRGFEKDRLGQLVHVGELKFGRYTRATAAGVTVYLTVYDQKHDKIKASGVLTIELWQLQADADERLLGRWRYEPAALEEHWLEGFLTYHYKFELPWREGREPTGAGVTIRVRFEELLTGEVFEIQKLVGLQVEEAGD